MIGLDTNVVVRYLVRDDPEQTAVAESVIDALTSQEQGFVSLVVVVETWWVLRTSYGFSRADCLTALDALVASRELVVERSDVVRQGLRRAADGADLVDAVIELSGRSAGCAETVTFDRRAARGTGMRLLGS